MTNPRHKLTDEQKIKVVQRLAAYDSPAVILKWLREEYALTVDRTAVTYYDPNSYAGRRCPERWKTLFFAMRKATVANWAEIGAANKMVRVRWLDRLVHDAMDRGDAKLAAQILAQVAREMDPRYATKKQEYRQPPARDISDAELDRRIAAAAAALGLELGPIADAGRAASRDGAGFGAAPHSPMTGKIAFS